ncbi:hypothetical protein O7627_25215 [Solwaraspora sp. WMMD1047]|uniref:hypothetical protein n=1 Tax=Solwaraspora sp. WMMD1047 TaxID=3016102 RepID=UPI002417B1B3|nr:hypothetical protein [Solwaraspora sp. WMMD1047]MDG4832585.1 hypothetical protein [Solwaraspora sp. WMMD1047]
MSQLSPFDPDPTEPAPAGSPETTRLRLLITAKTAPRPSDSVDETMYAAGLSTDPHRPGWIRLYPVDPRDLAEEGRLQAYDLVSVDARRARHDPRRESWRPAMHTLIREVHLKQWQRRREWLDPYVEVSMCRLDRDARQRTGGRSLGLVRPTDVDGLLLTPHPAWTPPERRRLLAYLGRVDPDPDDDHGLPEVPRFSGAYRYRCQDRSCAGHRQRIDDWEFVALQRRLAGLSDDRLLRALRSIYLDRMCGPDRDLAFYVGRGSGPEQEFQVLGGYWPPRR